MSIEISCNNEIKAQNRFIVYHWIKSMFTKKQLENARILCLPGREGLELFEIWDKLKIKRKNIVCLTNNKDEYAVMKKANRAKVIFQDVLNLNIDNAIKIFKENKIKKFDIIYLDFYKEFSVKTLIYYSLIAHLYLKNFGVFGCTFLMKREKCEAFKTMVKIAETLKPFKKASKELGVYSKYWRLIQLKIWIDILLSIDLLNKNTLGEVIEILASSILEPVQYQLSDVGFYPLCDLKTKYISPKGSPMGTILSKYRNINQTKHFGIKRKEFVYKKVFSWLNNGPIINIKKNEENEQNENDIKKIEALNYLKEFKDASDLKDISELTGYTPNQLRAFKAHMTMGTYN